MNRRPTVVLSLIPIVMICAVLTASLSLAQEKGAAQQQPAPKEAAQKGEVGAGREYTAVILPAAGSSNMTPSEIRFKIDKFTTPAEKEALRGVLDKSGQSAVLTYAQNRTIGRLVRAGSRGVDIFYAAEEKTDKGDRIVVVTKRFPVYPGTVMNVDTMKYPFTVAWFYPNADGKGEGTILGATSLEMDAKGEVDVKAYKASVANLANVRAK